MANLLINVHHCHSFGARTTARLILIAVALCCWQANDGQTYDVKATLEAVCGDGHGQQQAVADFVTPRQVSDLIELYEKQPELCTNGTQFADSFKRLGEILADSKVMEDVCSAYTYEKLRAFHLDFIHYYKPELSRNQLLEEKKMSESGCFMDICPGRIRLKPIPEALRRFFILFAKQINSACKHHLVTSLKDFVIDDNIIEEAEYKLIREYRSRKFVNMKFFRDSSGHDLVGEHLKPRKFFDLEILNFARPTAAAETPQGATTTNKEENASAEEAGVKLHVLVRFNDRLKRIKDACSHRFMPIYEDLFAPVIKLNNLGYRDHLKSQLEDRVLDETPEFTRWLGIIEICELFKDIEVIHDSSAMTALASVIRDKNIAQIRGIKERRQAELQVKKLKVLSAEEAAVFKRNLAKEPQLIAYVIKPVELVHKRVPFTPRMWLSEQWQTNKEVDNFQKDIDKIIHRRTSEFKLIMRKLIDQLKDFYHTHKKEIENRDENSFLGNLMWFFDRHNSSIKLVLILISTLGVIGVHFG